MTDPTERGQWARRSGFILAATGSAIGLGNLWRFPTVTGENGGAAFILVYAACLVLVGLPILLAELTLGRHTGGNAVGAFATGGGRRWKAVGALAVITSLMILSYYSVIASWTFGYIFKTAGGAFRNIEDSDAVRTTFQSLTGSPWLALGLHGLFMTGTMLVVVGGVRRGLERWTRVLMPLLFLVLLLLVARSLTLPGAEKGIAFFLRPDFSKVDGATFLNALSQVFFSLGLGMGIMITYGSYVPRKHDLAAGTLWIGGLDTLIALLAGLAVFPALFTIPGLQPAEGPPLIFLVLPNIFDQIPGGHLFGTGFFILLTLSALTSSISLLEVVVSFLIDEWGLARKVAVALAGTAAILLGVPSALGEGALLTLSDLPLLGTSFLTVVDAVFGKFSLTVGALMVCIFVGWRVSSKDALRQVDPAGSRAWVYRSWRVAVRFVCPVFIVLIMVSLVYQWISAM